MSYKKALILLIIFTSTSAIAVFFLNYLTDPLCQFACTEIRQSKISLNPYYKNAQRILKHSDATQIIVGSSRGQTTSPIWYSQQTKALTLNLSIAGANINTKQSLIKYAEAHLKLKKIIWYADFYEFLPTVSDEKNFIDVSMLNSFGWTDIFSINKFKTIFDHNTIEASFKLLQSKNNSQTLDQGSGSDLALSSCARKNLSEAEIELVSKKLESEINKTYQKYTDNIFKSSYSKDKLDQFKALLDQLTSRGLEVDIIIPGYHPYFLKKLKLEKPSVYANHFEWKNNLVKYQTEKIQIFDNFENEKSKQVSEYFWNDGDHFTCLQASYFLMK